MKRTRVMAIMGCSWSLSLSEYLPFNCAAPDCKSNDTAAVVRWPFLRPGMTTVYPPPLCYMLNGASDNAAISRSGCCAVVFLITLLIGLGPFLR